MRKSLALSVALVSACSVFAQSASIVYPCYRPAGTPKVDGDVAADPAWRGIPAVTGFSVLGSSYAVAKQTTAWACWDAEAVYVAVVCEEPDVAELAPKVKDGGQFWTEDGVEIFLQPGGKGQTYQFGVTSGGARGVGEGRADWRLCSAAAKVGKDSYAIECRIPFKAMDCAAPVASAEPWRVGFCRNIYATKSGGDKFTSWPALDSRFLEPHNFAPFTFHAEPATAEVGSRATRSLNQPYRDDLLASITKAAPAGREYADVLRDASGSKTFGATATELSAAWRRIEELQRRAEAAPVLELRRALLGLQELVRRSYDTKYRYLITQLLEE